MPQRRMFLIVGLFALLAGCSPASPVTTPAAGSASPPTPASTSATPSPATSTPTTPVLPDATGALDVSSHELSAFASPSGAIWCAVSSQGAWCHFPADFQGKIPSSKKICPEEMLDVTGVAVTKKVAYFCSGDPTAFPATENAGGDIDWWQGTGYPKVKYNGFTLVTLPHGKKLAAGNFVCLSAKNGVTCANTGAGIGFRMARAGVTMLP